MKQFKYVAVCGATAKNLQKKNADAVRCNWLPTEITPNFIFCGAMWD